MWDWLKRKAAAPKVVTERPAPAPAVASAPVMALPALAAPRAAPALALDAGTFLSWLLEAPSPSDCAISVPELEALASIDALVSGGLPIQELLPRAPALIPQLLRALRQSDISLPALVDRVSKDLVLAAEVMRMARSVAYSRDAEVHDLGRAIASLGEQGLQRAISRVVLRPLMQSGGGKLSALAAQRLWDHTELKSTLCSTKALAAGLDPFDGFMAGMLHSAGWTVALRHLDLRTPPPWPWSREFSESLAARRDPLFGKVVGTWQVSPALTALAAEAIEPGLVRGSSALARALLESDREASAHVVGEAVAALREPEPVPRLVPAARAVAAADTEVPELQSTGFEVTAFADTQW